jgi:adhesin transport system outer membrane protein
MSCWLRSSWSLIKTLVKIFFIILIGVYASVILAHDEFKILLSKSINKYPLVQSAKNQLESSRSDIDSAKWNFYPTPSISYEQGSKMQAGMLNRTTQFLRLQQPVWTAGRLDAQLQKSRLNYQSTEFLVEEQKLQAAFKWLQLWSEYQSSDEKINIFSNSEKKHISYVHQIERRADMGFAARSDIQLSLSRLNSVRAQLLQSSFAKKLANTKLEQMLSQPLTQEADLFKASGWPKDQKSIVAISENLSSMQIDELVLTSPAVRRSMAAIDAAEQDVKIAQSRNMPEVYARAEIRHGDVLGNDRIVFVGLNSSFGAGLSNFSAIASAIAKIDVQRSETEARKRDIQEQISSNLQNFHSQLAQLGQLEQNLSNIQDYLESTERQYLSGRRTWQEIMNNAREESQIRAQLADTKAQVWLTLQRHRIFTRGLDEYLSRNSLASEQLNK